jgi:ABC-2 type transport system ATP-binding protein
MVTSEKYSIETESLTKVFGTQAAVDHIDISVHKGEIFGFLGANGAGKTTTIRMLCGLLKPTSGRGHVAGFDIMKETGSIRFRIGYMSQKFSLYTDLSVMNNMRLFGSLYNLKRKVLNQRIEEMSEFLQLKDLLNRQTGGLPWGWQQRLSLACANLHKPQIVFLDEPTGSVDPVSRRNFWELIRRLSDEGTTVFVTTHHMDEAEYCHRVSIMIDGKIGAVDSPQRLKETYDSSSLHEVFISLVSQGILPEGNGTDD